MGSKIKAKLVYVLMITALLSAVIAPACQAAWGNGKTLIEICTAQGIETIAIDANDTPPDDQQSSMPSCDFCFQQTHIHFADIEATTLTYTTYSLPKYKITADNAEYLDPLLFPYQSQAPPLES